MRSHMESLRHTWSCSCGEALSVEAYPSRTEVDGFEFPKRVICHCGNNYKITLTKKGYQKYDLDSNRDYHT